MDINKIVIVGGGSAGWMTAASLIRAYPEKDISVIESPDVPIVGVGESTLGQITRWAQWIGIDEKDFMPKTNATYKLSIKFTDFYRENSGSFHYPFGRPFLNPTSNGMNDWYVKKAFDSQLHSSDYARCFFPGLTLAENNKINKNENGQLDNFDFEKNAAYHFDATLFGAWLRDNFCKPRNVKVINKTVSEIKTDNSGVSKLILNDGSEVIADLYVDCTGWRSLLLGGALQEPFENYENILPNNRAWATQIPYTDIEKEMEPFTNCTALDNGWVWNIPIWSRLGTGYVYSDKYISSDEALNDFKNYLRSDKMTVPDKNRLVEEFTYKDIKFRIGIHRNTWVKNVVAIGLSAGFIEPLESNGLFTIHEFLFHLVKSLNRGTANQWDRDAYNAVTKKQFMAFLEFVAIHYALSNRTSSKYWLDVTNRVYQPKVSLLENYGYIGFQDLAEKRHNVNRYYEDEGIHCIATGMNYFPVDINIIRRWENWEKTDYYTNTLPVITAWEELKSKWKKVADESPTMYKYLKDNIYVDR
jgi:hypothetical protein